MFKINILSATLDLLMIKIQLNYNHKLIYHLSPTVRLLIYAVCMLFINIFPDKRQYAPHL